MPLSTAEIVERHKACFLAADLDGVLEDYSPGILMISPDGVVARNVEDMRQLLVNAFAELRAPGVRLSYDTTAVEGDYGIVTWSAETADTVYELGTDTFVVRDEKIIAQTFAVKSRPKNPSK